MREIKPISLNKLARGLSTMDKIKLGILYIRLSKNEVKEMKDILKNEARSIIAEMKEPKMSILRAMEAYLDMYVDNLSKKDTLRLYMAYLEIKEALDNAQQQYAKFEFLAKLYQTYMNEGWTVKPTGNLAKKIKSLKESEAVKTILGEKKVAAKKEVKPAAAKKKASKKKANPAMAKKIKKKSKR